MKIVLPKPPSVNHLYAYTSVGGFAHSYVTKEGKMWFKKAGQIVHSTLKLKEPLATNVLLTVDLFTARSRDLDNSLKGILDVLQKCLECGKSKCSHKTRILLNDSQVFKMTVEKHKVAHLTEERVEIEVLPYEVI